MRMNVAWVAVVSARLVNLFGPTGVKAHDSTEDGLNIPIH